MITGAHAIIYSKNAEADRVFLRDVLGFPHVDVGGGWLIFGLPPSEVAVHPHDENNHHEFYLMCADIRALIRTLGERGVPCSAPHSERWGELVQVTLPGGGTLGIYQPHHPRPPNPAAPKKIVRAKRASSGGSKRRKAPATRKPK